MSNNLPWPETQEIPATHVVPSSNMRPTIPTLPRPYNPEILSPIEASISSNDSLMKHIDKHGLGVAIREEITGDGNCWYSSNVDLIRKHKMKAPDNPNELRKAVINSIKSHPQMHQWVQSIFNGKKRDFNRFLKEQSLPGTFVDNHGICVIATSDYLNVNYHIVGTSNTNKAPVSKFGRLDKDRPFFSHWLLSGHNR